MIIYLACAHIHWSMMATPPSLRSSRSSMDGSKRTISGNNFLSSFSSTKMREIKQVYKSIYSVYDCYIVIDFMSCKIHNPLYTLYKWNSECAAMSLPSPSASVATNTLSNLCFFIKLRIFLTAPFRLGTSSLWPQIKSFLRRWTPRYGPPFAEPSLA